MLRYTHVKQMVERMSRVNYYFFKFFVQEGQKSCGPQQSNFVTFKG